MSDGPKRIIVPSNRSHDSIVTVERNAGVENMVARALGIIDEQLTKLGSKSRVGGLGGLLDEKEARMLRGYVQSLVEISKEEREREKNDKTTEDLKALTDEQLLELAQQKLNTVKDIK